MTDSIKMTIDGDLLGNLRNYRTDVMGDVVDATTIIALSVMADAKRSIQRGDKTGVTYQLYGPKRTHQASAPGEAPASDTGRLANSINMHTLNPLSYAVFTNLPYGRYLEFGTTDISERPWLRPARDINAQEFKDSITAALLRG